MQILLTKFSGKFHHVLSKISVFSRHNKTYPQSILSYLPYYVNFTQKMSIKWQPTIPRWCIPLHQNTVHLNHIPDHIQHGSCYSNEATNLSSNVLSHARMGTLRRATSICITQTWSTGAPHSWDPVWRANLLLSQEPATSLVRSEVHKQWEQRWLSSGL
jgi:hypothetical protein